MDDKKIEKQEAQAVIWDELDKKEEARAGKKPAGEYWEVKSGKTEKIVGVITVTLGLGLFVGSLYYQLILGCLMGLFMIILGSYLTINSYYGCVRVYRDRFECRKLFKVTKIIPFAEIDHVIRENEENTTMLRFYVKGKKRPVFSVNEYHQNAARIRKLAREKGWYSAASNHADTMNWKDIEALHNEFKEATKEDKTRDK